MVRQAKVYYYISTSVSYCFYYNEGPWDDFHGFTFVFSVSTNRSVNFNLIYQHNLIWQFVTIVHFAEFISYEFVQSHLGLHAYCFLKNLMFSYESHHTNSYQITTS